MPRTPSPSPRTLPAIALTLAIVGILCVPLACLMTTRSATSINFPLLVLSYAFAPALVTFAALLAFLSLLISKPRRAAALPIAALSSSLLALAAVLLLHFVFFPAIARSRELANRSVCVSGLKGLRQAMSHYAAGNPDSYPLAPPIPTSNPTPDSSPAVDRSPDPPK